MAARRLEMSVLCVLKESEVEKERGWPDDLKGAETVMVERKEDFYLDCLMPHTKTVT